MSLLDLHWVHLHPAQNLEAKVLFLPPLTYAREVRIQNFARFLSYYIIRYYLVDSDLHSREICSTIKTVKSPKTTKNSATGNELSIFNAVMTSSMLSCTSGNKSNRQVPRKTPPAKQFSRLITRVYLYVHKTTIMK